MLSKCNTSRPVVDNDAVKNSMTTQTTCSSKASPDSLRGAAVKLQEFRYVPFQVSFMSSTTPSGSLRRRDSDSMTTSVYRTVTNTMSVSVSADFQKIT